MAEDLYIGSTGAILYDSTGEPLAMFMATDLLKEMVRATKASRRKIEDMNDAVRDGLTSIPCPHCESAGLIPTVPKEGHPSGRGVMQDIRLAHIALCHPEHYADAARDRYAEVYNQFAEQAATRKKLEELERCAKAAHGILDTGVADWIWDGEHVRCDMCEQVIDWKAMAALKIPGYRFDDGRITFDSLTRGRDIAKGWSANRGEVWNS